MSEYKNVIEKMNLIQHPEGGYYRRNWQSLFTGDLKDSSGKVVFQDRRIGSSIIYLLPSIEVTTWHRVSCDEMWHFYSGSPLRLYVISKLKGLEEMILGPNVLSGHFVQLIIPRLTWFAAEVIQEDSYSLCGCTLYPSFSYTDFEIAERQKLLDDYPQYRDTIEKIYNR